MIVNAFITGLLVAVVTCVNIWAVPKKPQKVLEPIMVGLELGTGFPHAWADVLGDTNSSSNSENIYIARPNVHLGIILGYEFYAPIGNTYCKWGPELGLSYEWRGGTRISPYNRSLAEQYLHVPVSFKLLVFPLVKSKFQEEELIEWIEQRLAFLIGVAAGYEFNILLSSVYRREQKAIRLYPFSKLIDPADGSKVTLPNSLGSVFFSIFVYIYNPIYVGCKLRIPIELAYENYDDNNLFNKKFYHKIRAESTSYFELYFGIDLHKWL